MSKKQDFDVEDILNKLAVMRQQVPFLIKAPARPRTTDTASADAFVALGEESMLQFEMETLADALESFADDLSASIEDARRQALEQALEVYYTTEKLSREPEHANLIPVVEELREAYRRDFGKEIPERP
jgi:hypothetical protein